MAKHNQKSKSKVKAEETKVEEVVSVEENATVVEETKAEETTSNKKPVKKEKKQKHTKAKVNREPKRSKFKEVFAELKKVNWPTFGKTMKQTGMVLSVVAIFMLVTLGIDSLLSWLLKLITNI